MNIIFLGTPLFAVPSLDILVKHGYTISAVITAPGKPAGRGLKIKESPVKIYADEKGLNTIQPIKLNDPEFLNKMQLLKPDLMIVVAFRMMPKALWQMPKLGTFNLHGSLLPQYRGAAPINRAIMNGETETGVTTFFLKQEIDTGNIIFREKVLIAPDETAGELHDMLMHAGAQLVLKTVQAIEYNKVTVTNQADLIKDGEVLKMAPKIYADDCKIDWKMNAASIHNQVRGLSPFPGAFTHICDHEGNSLHLKIFRTQFCTEVIAGEPGIITVHNNKLFFKCGDAALEVLELQQEGKKKMMASDYLKGFRVEKGWKVQFTN